MRSTQAEEQLLEALATEAFVAERQLDRVKRHLARGTQDCDDLQQAIYDCETHIAEQRTTLLQELAEASERVTIAASVMRHSAMLANTISADQSRESDGEDEAQHDVSPSKEAQPPMPDPGNTSGESDDGLSADDEGVGLEASVLAGARQRLATIVGIPEGLMGLSDEDERVPKIRIVSTGDGQLVLEGSHETLFDVMKRLATVQEQIKFESDRAEGLKEKRSTLQANLEKMRANAEQEAKQHRQAIERLETTADTLRNRDNQAYVVRAFVLESNGLFQSFESSSCHQSVGA